MVTPGKRWEPAELPLGDVRVRPDFQFRVLGADSANLNRIVSTLQAGGEARDPVRVARIGKALYLVDGFHRLEAYRKAGRQTIPALVAKLSLEEAREAARASNAMNGKGYSRADRQCIFDDYVAEGRHRDEDGRTKSSRTIEVELGGLYSHETIRKRLKDRGELDEETEFPHGYKPRLSDEDLEAELAEEAEDCLRRFGSLLPDLEPWDRNRLLEVAKGIVVAVEGGEKPDVVKLLDAATPF